MEAKNTALHDLGRLAEVDEHRLDAVLWGRFGVVSDSKSFDDSGIILVEDLDRTLGEAPGFRLELHLLELPLRSPMRARLRRALRIQHYAQAQAYAVGEVGDKLVLVCEPQVGVRFDPALATDASMERMAIALAALVSELHKIGIHGIRFDCTQLKVDDEQVSVGGFSHLVGNERPANEDLEALVNLFPDVPRYRDIPWPATSASAESFVEQLQGRLRGQDPVSFPAEPPFVGREIAMSTLEQGIDQAKIARPTAIVVKGPRGIGKSRLLHEFATGQLKENDFVVLTGAWQTDSGDPRSGLLNALDQLPPALMLLEPDERDDIRRSIQRATKHLGAIVARSAPDLGSVLRHAEELPEIELGGDFSRHAAVIADVLKSIGTRQRPLLLVLDNIENLDANSAAILEIITQSQPAHYTLMVMGMRTQTRQETSLKFDYESINLEPLLIDEVKDFMSRSLGGEIEEFDALAQVLQDLSKGLPLALGANLRSWLERGRIARGLDEVWRARKSLRDELADEPSIRDIFEARLTGADEATQKMALLIATFGSELRAPFFEIFSDGQAPAVEELCERGLLVRAATGVRFPHDTIRELVLEAFPEDIRRKTHQTIAGVLTKQGAPVPQIVYHRDYGFDLEAATPDDFDKLSRLHVEAGRDRLDVYDLERARWHLERALEHSHDPGQRGIAAEGLADVCLLQEDLDTAVSLYTAIIATAAPVAGVRVASKVAQFLYGKNADADAQELGIMALEMAGEPTPTSPFGKLWVLLTSFTRVWLNNKCTFDESLRGSLCRLYMWMAYVSLIDDPVSVAMYTARARWIAIGLRTGSAAMVRSTEAGLATVLGFADYADGIFALSDEIAHETKDAWAQGMVFHHWGGALLAVERYSEGQDRLDDGIAAFRETGDVSIAIISMFYKCIYGRDREHADVVLGWIDEALTTGRRNGKRTASLPLRSIKLHVLARQGRRDLDERISAQAEANKNTTVPPMERLASQIELAYACLECSNYELAMEQVRMSQASSEEMGGTVPEFCQEVNLVAALVVLSRPSPTREERKLLKSAVKKFRAAIKRAPRLQVLGDLLEIRLLTEVGKTDKALEYASKIVGEFDRHENLHATRQAHRTLVRLLKGTQAVVAAAEHEKLARNLGRRLGLSDNVLLSDFSEIGLEVGILALTDESNYNLEQTQTDALPAAGMLTSAVSKKPTPRPKTTSEFDFDDQSDVLEAWALTDIVAPNTSTLGSVISPVRAVVSASIEENTLDIVCPNPDLEVPVGSGDLQILLINMILAGRDAIGQKIKIRVRLEEVEVDGSDDHGRALPANKYLLIQTTAQGEGGQVPVIGAFATCENLVQGMDGFLSASTDRGRVELRAHIPLAGTPQASGTAAWGGIVIVHQDATVRATLGTALVEFGVDWQQYEPDAFEVGMAEGASILFADGKTLQHVRILQPLWSMRMVELVKRGAEPSFGGGYDELYLPFSVSELEQMLENS